MRALVTGAAGFVGRHVIRRLLDDGFDVTAFDLLDAGLVDADSIIGDLRDADGIAAAVAGHHVICHLGGIGDVYLAGERPAMAAEVNVVGSANIAAAAAAHDARVIYASTWEVYGEPEYEPVDEDHPTRPDHPYNITKLGGEQMLLAADRLRDVPVVSLRLGTAYGTGLRPNSVFRIFIDRARKGQPLTIQGDGTQGRQFTHVSDIARAFSLAAKSDVRGVALNTVASEMVSIKSLAERVVARYPTELTFGDSRPGDVPPSKVSAERIASVLGWRAEMDFTQGLASLMDAVEAED
ncbi:MAG: NAD-dependent epimerase/dehydratase family protein [Acidimicrobiia bacterium]